MKMGDVFKSVHEPLALDKLVPLSEASYHKVNPKGSYEEAVNSLKNHEMDKGSVYVSDNPISPYWYVNGWVVYNLMHLSDQFLSLSAKAVGELERYSENMLQEGRYQDYFKHVDKRVAFYLLHKMYEQIPRENRYAIFRDIYTSAEYGFSKLPKEWVRDVFSHSDPSYFRKKLRTDKEGLIQLYRGVSSMSSGIDNAYSWTVDLSTALFFAERFQTGEAVVYEGKVHVEDVVDFITHRNEHEILVLPENVMEVRPLELYNMQEGLPGGGEVMQLYHFYREQISPKWFRNPEGIHGVKHTKRVLLLALILGHLHGLSEDDMEILAYASLLHDTGRTCDEVDDYHGDKSLKKINKIDPGIFQLSREDEKIARFIIEYHAPHDEVGLTALDKSHFSDKSRGRQLFDIFKDADGLDRVRIGRLSLHYLRTEEAMRLPLLAWQVLKNLE